MALTKFTEATNVIESLSDKPNAIEGLSATELKKKFDHIGGLIKTYINSTLTVEIDGLLASLTNTVNGMSSTLNAHHTRHEVGGEDAISVTAGMITDGEITAAKLAASAITDKLGYTPMSNADGSVTAAKIQDGAVSTIYTGTLSTSWTGSSAPYSQELSISGITASDNPIIDVNPSSNYATAQNQVEDWGLIYRAVPAAGKITFYASEAPTHQIPVKILCVRK